MSPQEMKIQLLGLLKAHFGYESFRPGQEQAIDSVISGRDTLVIMPTGGGKSLIYQLPALILEGVTLVISPLISLMKDQVDSLTKVGIPATYINSALSPQETIGRLREVKDGKYKLVYIAPERFYNLEFIQVLAEIKVSLFAIDEAHCISQWGHDFRPSYLRLKEAAKLVGRPPLLALTATATPEVRQDIAKQLALSNPEMIITGFARPNLQFGIIPASDSAKVEIVMQTIESLPNQSGIVYVGTRNKADELLAILNDYQIRAVGYHAGMDAESRQWVQDSFMSGEAQVVVATNAFGLGINKKDIRFVIHHDLPGTIEAYYQEAGRAGRDGQSSYCLLLYSPKDRYLREFFIKGDNPPPNIITEIYDYLLNHRANQNEGSILVTYSEIAESLSENLPEMAIGTALKILEREGYISRPNERTSSAFVKTAVALDSHLAALGKRAKTQIEAWQKIWEQFQDKLVGGWHANLEEVASGLGIKKEAIIRALKKLQESGLLEYQPPFRGTEIRVLKTVAPEDLEIDFLALKDKLRRAHEKLDEMESYAFHRGCRQEYILKYFGDPQAKGCGICDWCLGGRNNSWQTKEYLG